MNLESLRESLRQDARALRTALSDPALPRGREAALELRVGGARKGSFGNAEWRHGAGANAAAAVHVFVDAGDADEDKVFGRLRKGESTVGGPVLEPQPGSALLKYVLLGDAEAEAHNGGLAELALAADAHVAVGAYLRAPKEQTLGAAVAAHASMFPWVFDADDVAELRPGDACFIALGGRFSAALSIDWASVFAGPLEALAPFATRGEPLHLALDASLSLAFRFAMEDSFRLVFVREDDGILRAVLNLADSQSFRVRARAGATVHFAEPDVAREVLAQLAASLLAPAQPLRALASAVEEAIDGYHGALASIRSGLGAAAARLDAYFAELGVERALQQLAALQSLAGDAGVVAPVFAQRLQLTLGEAEALLQRLDALPRELADRLGDRIDALLAPLHSPPLLEKPRVAAARLLERLDQIEAAILGIASTRIAAALELEYERLASDQTLLDVELDPRAMEFAGRHADLLALRLDRLLVDTERVGSGVRLRLFLHQQRIRRSFSLGLSIGDVLRDVASRGREWIVAERWVQPGTGPALRRQRSVALSGHREHNEAFIGSAASCRGDFDARLKQLDGEAGPWRFGLSLQFGSRTPRAGRSWLHAAADFGALWGIVAEDGVAGLLERLVAIDALGKPLAFEVSLAFGNAAFDCQPFLHAWADADADVVASALAAALPVVGNIAARQTPAARRATYAPAMRVLAGSEGVDLRNASAIGRHVAVQLQDAPPALRAFERRVHPQFLGSVAQIATHPKAGGRVEGMLREFRQAGQLLAAVARPPGPGAAGRERIGAALHGLDLGWINRFVLRWQGALLLQLARANGVPERAIRPRMALLVDPDGAAVRHVIAPLG